MNAGYLPPAAHFRAGPVVIVDADAAAWLLSSTNLGAVFAARGRDAGRPVASQVAALLAVAGCGASVTSAATSGIGSESDATASISEASTVLLGAAPVAELGVSAPCTTTEAAEQLKITDRAVRDAITAGRLPAERRGRSYLIDQADIDDYAARRTA